MQQLCFATLALWFRRPPPRSSAFTLILPSDVARKSPLFFPACTHAIVVLPSVDSPLLIYCAPFPVTRGMHFAIASGTACGGRCSLFIGDAPLSSAYAPPYHWPGGTYSAPTATLPPAARARPLLFSGALSLGHTTFRPAAPRLPPHPYPSFTHSLSRSPSRAPRCAITGGCPAPSPPVPQYIRPLRRPAPFCPEGQKGNPCELPCAPRTLTRPRRPRAAAMRTLRGHTHSPSPSFPPAGVAGGCACGPRLPLPAGPAHPHHWL